MQDTNSPSARGLVTRAFLLSLITAQLSHHAAQRPLSMF